MTDKALEEIVDPYVMMQFIDKEHLEANSNTCPMCKTSDALHETDSFLPKSNLYYGVKYNCNNCDESFVAVDPNCFLPSVDEEIKESGIIRVEFGYEEIEHLLSIEEEYWKNT